MTKKLLNWTLMAALVVGLGWSVTSCKDDDDDDKNTSEQRNADAAAQDTNEAQVAWRWLCALTDVQTLDDNWASKTYEPTIGVASENNANTRLVVVADADEARMNFANMADVDVNQLGSSKTFDVKGVGKLTWTPSAAGAQNLAEVTVDTKLIPHLQKIVYCTKDQTGLNGIFSTNVEGTAYYRFGDVIRDAAGYYWVCVRPSHEVDDKGDSHWINIFNSTTNKDIPTENIYDKYNKKYNNKTILFPTKLKYKREHIYNLGNLIWAILNPEAYHTKVGDNGKGLGEFPYERHNEYFLKNVKSYWSQIPLSHNTDIWHLLFNKSVTQMQALTSLNFYYQGYSWIWGDNATLWCYSQSAFQTKIEGSESGDKVSRAVKTEGFDINRYTFKSSADNVGHEQTDGSKGYWVIRYAKGEELVSGGKYTPYSRIPGCEDVYRYYANKDVAPGTDWTTAKKADEPVPSHDATKARVGDILGLNSMLYEVEDDANNGGVAIGIVSYITGNFTTNPIDKSSPRRVLVMSLKEAGTLAWGENGSCSTRSEVTVGTQLPVSGINDTQKLAEDGHSHPAAKNCYTFWDDMMYGNNPGADKQLMTFCLPSTGQWVFALEGLTGKSFTNMTDGAELINILNNVYEKAGVKQISYDYITKPFANSGVETVSFWTSTEASETEAYVLTINKRTGPVFEKKLKSEKYHVLPFIIYG